MFWSGETLLERGSEIVSGFNPKMIDCAALVLSVGPEYYVTPSVDDNDRSKWLKRFLHAPSIEEAGAKPLYSSTSSERSRWEERSRGDSLTIPPNRFAFLITEERVSIPKNAIGFISLKAGKKFEGLINVSGFHVDPGYNGRLVYSVYNAGPSTIHVQRHESLFLLWLANLDVSETNYYYTGMAKNQIDSKVITSVNHGVHSLFSISEELKNLKRTVELHGFVGSALVGIVAVVAAIVTVISFINGS